jgi:hypothetical protein
MGQVSSVRNALRGSRPVSDRGCHIGIHESAQDVRDGRYVVLLDDGERRIEGSVLDWMQLASKSQLGHSGKQP